MLFSREEYQKRKQRKLEWDMFAEKHHDAFVLEDPMKYAQTCEEIAQYYKPWVDSYECLRLMEAVHGGAENHEIIYREVVSELCSNYTVITKISNLKPEYKKKKFESVPIDYNFAKFYYDMSKIFGVADVFYDDGNTMLSVSNGANPTFIGMIYEYDTYYLCGAKCEIFGYKNLDLKERNYTHLNNIVETTPCNIHLAMSAEYDIIKIMLNKSEKNIDVAGIVKAICTKYGKTLIVE